MDLTGAHHVALLTPNFERLRAFYGEILGFAEVGAYRDQRIIFLGAGSIAIELIERPLANPGAQGGWGHLAFQVTDIDATYAELKRRGAPFHVPPKDFPDDAPVARIAFFRDPDGNELQLVQPLGAGRYPAAE